MNFLIFCETKYQNYALLRWMISVGSKARIWAFLDLQQWVPIVNFCSIRFSFFPHKRWKSWWRWWKLLGRWDHRWLSIDQVSHTTRALLCQGFWSVVVPPLIPVINYFATPGVWTIILPPLLLWSIILPCTLLFNWYVILMTFLQLQAVHLLNPPSLVEGVLGLVRDGSRHQNG